MGFGRQYTHNPIPEVIYGELVAAPGSGKTTLIPQWVKGTGKTSVIVDADNRFDQVVTADLQNTFYPLSDLAYEMADAYCIDKILREQMPALMKSGKAGLIAVDSLTAIIEPLVIKAQADFEHGVIKSLIAGFKDKSTAMKLLQSSVSMWGIDTLWVYHYRESTGADRVKKTVTSITDTELARLYRSINLKMEIVIDNKGRRGIKVLRARGGRTGVTIWDDSGSWLGIREKVETAVWGGLTQTEQQELVKAIPTTFTSPQEAIAWAWGYSEANGNFFNDAVHAKNAYGKLKETLKEELGDELDAAAMYSGWITDVLRRQDEKANPEPVEPENEG